MSKAKETKTRAIAGFPEKLQQEVQTAWRLADGLPTVLETYKPRVVIRTSPINGKPHTALVVGVDGDGQKAFGLVDDGSGNVDVKVFDLSSIGFPTNLDSIEQCTGEILPWKAYWLAKEGREYVNVSAADAEKADEDGEAEGADDGR